MADSKCLNTQTGPRDSLIHCGICHAVVDTPKMLPCLHSFCAHCLSSWADSAAEKDPVKYKNKIECPSCKEEYDIPTGGVRCLKTNYFLLKLKEKKTIQHKLDANDVIPCTACDETSSSSVSQCFECHDFLCTKCVEAHKRLRGLRDHQLQSLEDFCADTLSRPLFNLPEQERCLKHRGEALLFFCEKCELPICRNCTVVDHPMDHKHVDLEEAAGRCTDELNSLALASQNVSCTFDLPIEADEKSLADLKAAVVKAEDDIIKASDRIKTASLRKLHELEAKHENDIRSHKSKLQSLQTRLRTSLEVTELVTKIGSDHDKATMFFALSSTMKQACNVQPKAFRKSHAKVGFVPNEDLVDNLDGFGTLKIGGQFVVNTIYGQGQLTSPRCAVFNMDGDIVVTDNSRNIPVKVFGHVDGQIKTTINTAGVGGSDILGYSIPWGLDVGKDGQYFVTDGNPCVKVFDAQGNFSRFGIMLPSGHKSNDVEPVVHRNAMQRHSRHHQSLFQTQMAPNRVGANLLSLTIDHNDRLIVGSDKPSICLLDQDGTCTSYFSIPITPNFLAVTSTDRIIVSDHQKCHTVRVFDTAGNQLHTFDNPEGATTWSPTGICCVQPPQNEEGEEEIYVACNKSPAAIYRYSVTGKYLGVVTKKVNEPWGISVKRDSENDDLDLLVVDQDTIKLFKLEGY